MMRARESSVMAEALIVVAGLVPANYATPVVVQMAGTSPAMTIDSLATRRPAP